MIAKFLFADGTQIQTGSYVNDSIRLSKLNQTKFKLGKKEGFNLIDEEENNIKLP